MYAKDLKEVIRASLKVGSGEEEYNSLFVEGPPGIGKSEIFAQVAREEAEATGEEIGCIDLRLLLFDVTDLRGIPYPNMETKTAEWLSPDEMPVVGNDKHPKRGILLFDDMTTAPQLIQAAAYQLTLYPHKLGQAQLKPGWVIGAAGNRVVDRALVHKMPAPLANRFTHLELEPNIDDWIEWALKNQIDLSLISFMRSELAFLNNGHILFQFDAKREEKAFPTPRSWTKVSRWLQAGLSEGVLNDVIAGTVGAGAGTQFNSYRRLFSKIPSTDEILVKKNFAITPTEIDLKYALVTAVAQKAKGAQVDTAIIWATDHLTPEFGVLLIKMIAGQQRDALLKAPTFRRWITENKDIQL